MGSEPRLELIYDRDCPNIERARIAIGLALSEVGPDVTWIEWVRGDPATPLALRHFASPTVLVNGRDVGCDETAATHTDANACRVYVDDGGCVCGAPTAALIVRAIRGARAA